MKNKYVLVDTSAWILSFKKAGNMQLKIFLSNAILNEEAAICPIILLELVQGCRTEKERDDLREKLEILNMLLITPSVWERAYTLGYTLKRKGLSIPVVDLVIAATALENDCEILHADKHYEMIAKHFSLKTRQ